METNGNQWPKEGCKDEGGVKRQLSKENEERVRHEQLSEEKRQMEAACCQRLCLRHTMSHLSHSTRRVYVQCKFATKNSFSEYVITNSEYAKARAV